MNLKHSILTGAAFVVLALVTLIGTADTVHAQTFDPIIKSSIVNDAAGANSSFITEFGIGGPDCDIPVAYDCDYQFGATVFFIPPEWKITPAADVPIGALVGRLDALATLGLLNNPCDQILEVQFKMMNASVDITDTVAFDDTDPEGAEGSGTGDVFEDRDGNGLLDAVDKYPEFINRITDNAQPIRRSAGIQRVAGADVLLQFLIFDPGSVIIREIPSDEELGYPTVTFLQAIGDPEAEPEPGPITDFCAPLETVNVTFGISRDNICTDAEELDPINRGICEVTSAVLLECDDFEDNDADGKVNDGCPTRGDAPETACDDDVDDDKDGWINDGCPGVEEDPDQGNPGPDEASAVTSPDESGVPLFTNPAAGDYTFTAISLSQRDADGDGYENILDTCPFDVNQGNPRIKGDADMDIPPDGLDAACDPDDEEAQVDFDNDGYQNRQDNCPLVANGEEEDNQQDSDVNEQGDPRPDGIGDACDPNPLVPDGELLSAKLTSDITIVAGAGDGGDNGGGPPADNGDGDDGGGGATIFIIIGIIAAVIVLGGGAFVLMRRGGGGGAD